MLRLIWQQFRKWHDFIILQLIQEKKIQFSQKLDKVKDKGKEWIGKVKETKEKGNEMMNRWEEKSKEFIGNFVEMFGKQGKIVSIITSKCVGWLVGWLSSCFTSIVNSYGHVGIVSYPNQTVPGQASKRQFTSILHILLTLKDNCSSLIIMKTCPCNEHPLTPHFYIGKLRFTGVYIFSYFYSKT